MGGDDVGARLDVALVARGVPLTRSQLKNAIDRGEVRIGGIAAKASRRVREGDAVVVWIPPPEPAEALPENLDIEIVYEDAALAVVNKPAGMVVHPSPGHAGGTLVNALLFRIASLSGVGGVLRPGIVHRLDKDTSGLMVVSKGDHAHVALQTAIKAREVERVYVALVHGNVRGNEGRIETLYGRHPTERKRFTTRVREGRRAAMRWRVLERFVVGDSGAALTLVECRLETGRTHQIRVQMSERGHPIVGDAMYGGARRDEKAGLASLGRQFLHARRLSFVHPELGRRLTFEAPLPRELEAMLREVRG
ncbi:MAG: RluA family pseudouridine synthase [Deltaproteobacteria bacterium]|nr:RluA family pseudouridine synthase [Deltaproteobacteria bacterium]